MSSLVVQSNESNSIVLDADSYVTLLELREYLIDRGHTDWVNRIPVVNGQPSGDYSEAEQYARRATDWIDRHFSFVGVKTELTQRLKWPRKYASYPEESYRYYPHNEIPVLIKEAVCMVAEYYSDSKNDIDGVVSFANVVKKKKIDVVEIEYDSMIQRKFGASSSTILNPIYQLLRPLSFQRKGLMRA